MLQRLLERLRRFFFPPPGSSLPRRYLPLTMLVAVPLVILLAIPPAWEYSNTSQFCGTTCHTMPPEYNTYLVSPHARVPCVDCHIGRDWIAKQFVRKTGHLELIYKTITGQYEYPITVGKMRPARETCERCHFPEKFSDDSLRVIERFGDDEQNQAYAIYLLMHTGGGTQREGLGRGIHWHIENTIEFIALDREQQDIPWVRVTTPDGESVTYTSIDATIDTSDLSQYKLNQMDCITCHNRISHLIPSPETVVDTALYRGDISTDIPYIRAQAVQVLSTEYESPEDAEEAIAALDEYYQTNYPDFYSGNQALVEDAVQVVEKMYTDNTYPDQELDWMTHPDNIGHKESAGCFRCHDGKHFSPDGEAVRLECNLCHSVPQVVVPGEIEPTLPLTTGLEPATHLDSTWIARHHVELNETCSNCHTTENPGGVTNTSFCSNSECHGNDWEFAGFNAPELAVALGLIQQQPVSDIVPTVAPGMPVTYQDLQPLLAQACGQCHGDTPTKGLKVIEYAALMKGGEDGAVIVPGSPDDSLIVQTLTEGHFAKLTDEQMALLTQWIADGAPEGTPVVPAEPTSAAPAGPVTYDDTLQPILAEMCGTCHGDAKTAGLKVTEYATLMAGGQDGAVIVPGSPDDSVIIEKLTAGHYAKLTDEQMALLTQWIADGAPENATSGPAEAAPAATSTPAPTRTQAPAANPTPTEDLSQ